MNSIGFKDAEIFDKAHIASMQLDDAVHLFVKHRFVSSLTLAGASEEVFAQLLGAEGKKPATETSYELLVAFRGALNLDPRISTEPKSNFFKQWNHERNRVKHHDPKEPRQLCINDCDAAYWMIRRALANARELGVEIESKNDFDNWVISHVNL